MPAATHVLYSRAVKTRKNVSRAARNPFARLPRLRSPCERQAAALIGRLRDWLGDTSEPHVLRGRLCAHLNREGVRLHAALRRAARSDLADDFDQRAQALLRSAGTFARAYQAEALEELPTLYARVIDHVRGFATWVVETDSWLCPTPAAGVVKPGSAPPAAAARRPGVHPKRLTVDRGTLEVRYRRRRLKLVDGKPFDLLCYLAAHPAHRRTYGDVEQAIYGSTGLVNDHTIEAHASHLRRTLRAAKPTAGVWNDLATRVKCRAGRWFIDL